jgi:glycerol kinase
VIESIAYQTRDVIDKMSSASSQAISQLRVDGGASAVELLLQLQADQLRTTVARARVTETTALGAAWLAGLAEGVWGSLDDLEALWQPGGEATPSGAPDDANAAYDKWLRAVDRSRGWAVSDASSTGGAASTGDHGG